MTMSIPHRIQFVLTVISHCRKFLNFGGSLPIFRTVNSTMLPRMNPYIATVGGLGHATGVPLNGRPHFRAD